MNIRTLAEGSETPEQHSQLLTRPQSADGIAGLSR
jgi:hypothetical protein